MTDRRITLWVKSIFCFAVLLLFVPIAHADYDQLRRLSGKPFSDPSQIYDMPVDWKKQRIKYDSSEGNADIIITLDQHLYPALLSLIQKYAKKHSLKIVVKEGTCGISSEMLSRKAVDIGGFCCPPAKTDRLPGLRFHTVGINALALLVHPDNPIDNITLEQARKIFMGEIYLIMVCAKN